MPRLHQRGKLTLDGGIQILDPAVVVLVNGTFVRIVVQVGALYELNIVGGGVIGDLDNGYVGAQSLCPFYFPRSLLKHDPAETGASTRNRALNIFQRQWRLIADNRRISHIAYGRGCATRERKGREQACHCRDLRQGHVSSSQVESRPARSFVSGCRQKFYLLWIDRQSAIDGGSVPVRTGKRSGSVKLNKRRDRYFARVVCIGVRRRA